MMEQQTEILTLKVARLEALQAVFEKQGRACTEAYKTWGNTNLDQRVHIRHLFPNVGNENAKEKYHQLIQRLPAYKVVAGSKISLLLGQLAHWRAEGGLSQESLTALRAFIKAQIQVFQPEHQTPERPLDRRQSDAGTLYAVDTPIHYKLGTCGNVRALLKQL